MKITFKIPADAAFYKTESREFTQRQVDVAADSFLAANNVPLSPIRRFFVFVKSGEPGFRFDGEALASFGSSPSNTSEREISESYAAGANLKRFVGDMRATLEANPV